MPMVTRQVKQSRGSEVETPEHTACLCAERSCNAGGEASCKRRGAAEARGDPPRLVSRESAKLWANLLPKVAPLPGEPTWYYGVRSIWRPQLDEPGERGADWV